MLTPREMKTICRGKDKAIHEQAYLLAGLIRRAVWEKEMPRYEDLFPTVESAGADMSDQEMFRQVQILNARFGGAQVD